METGPWSGLPVAAPSLWGHWEGAQHLDQEHQGLSWTAGLSFKRVWKSEPRVLREVAGGFRQTLFTNLWLWHNLEEGTPFTGTVLVAATHTSSWGPCYFLPCPSLALLLLLPRWDQGLRSPKRKWRRLTLPAPNLLSPTLHLLSCFPYFCFCP